MAGLICSTQNTNTPCGWLSKVRKGDRKRKPPPGVEVHYMRAEPAMHISGKAVFFIEETYAASSNQQVHISICVFCGNIHWALGRVELIVLEGTRECRGEFLR